MAERSPCNAIGHRQLGFSEAENRREQSQLA